MGSARLLIWRELQWGYLWNKSCQIFLKLMRRVGDRSSAPATERHYFLRISSTRNKFSFVTWLRYFFMYIVRSYCIMLYFKVGQTRLVVFTVHLIDFLGHDPPNFHIYNPCFDILFSLLRSLWNNEYPLDVYKLGKDSCCPLCLHSR
jgi:hypothetical protein